MNKMNRGNCWQVREKGKGGKGEEGRRGRGEKGKREENRIPSKNRFFFHIMNKMNKGNWW